MSDTPSPVLPTIPKAKPSPGLSPSAGKKTAPAAGKPLTPAASTAAVKVKDPAWWRYGAVPYIVLLMVAAAADFFIPRDGLLGIGAGIGSVLFLLAFALLRKDLSTGESLFILLFAAINFFALASSGTALNWWGTLFVPILLLLTPTRCMEPAEPGVRYRSWWGFWGGRRPKEGSKGLIASIRSCLALFICILVGAICFILFLSIFAISNPVVSQIWDRIVEEWNRWVDYFHISWDFAIHVLYWLLGIILFGLYTFRRTKAGAPAASADTAPGRTLLPFLPLCTLLGINLAFGIATYTDIAYLWLNEVPEGISRTTYLHEGAGFIAWASALAAIILLIFFRRRGSARQSFLPKLLGYILVLQTLLLAVSVYMRLYYQISDYGFTVRRVQAAEAMLMGLAGLILLLCYMAGNGGFWKYVCRCFVIAALMLFAYGICSPTRIAASLNLRYIGTHPDWEFNIWDFGIGKFQVEEHLGFAEYVGRTLPQEKEEGCWNAATAFADKLERAALKVESRAQSDSWLTWTLAMQQDIPAAERILQRPISCHNVEPQDSLCASAGNGEPAAEQPAVEQPAAEQPATEQPSVEQPATETPRAPEPPAGEEIIKVDFSDAGETPHAPAANDTAALEVPAPAENPENSGNSGEAS